MGPGAVSAVAALAEPAAAERTLLFVDDEPNILSSLGRLFRGSGYRVLTADGGRRALQVLRAEHVDIVISDMRMPGMDGAQLLEQVRVAWPRITRILLTGYADVDSTVAAINRGEVYRYLAKPWNDAEMLQAVREAFERQFLRDEKERLERVVTRQNVELTTLNASLEHKVGLRTQALLQATEKLKKSYLASIKVFSHLLEVRDSQLSGHSRCVADLARRTGQTMGLSGAVLQDLFVAGLLHDIGHIGLPDELLARPVPRMSQDERARYNRHPVVGEHALMLLDDMHSVAAVIRAHHERHDGKGFPDGIGGDDITLPARILAICETFVDMQSGHLGARLDAAEARIMIARARGTLFHPEVVDAFLQLTVDGIPRKKAAPRAARTGELAPGLVLAADWVSTEGVILLAADQILTADLIARIRRYEVRDGLTLTLYVSEAAATAPVRAEGP